MEEIERPEKRRKLDCEKDDGNQASRSPRVVLNKINVDNALLERFRKIKRLARQKLGAKLEKKGNANERIDAGEKQKTSLELLKAADGSTNSNNEINLLEDNESTGCLEKREGISLFLADKLNADETVEVIDSSETWICKNNLSQKSAKRKRDENCNESTSFGKVTKFLESTSVSIDEGKQLGPLSGTNETAFSLSKSDEGSEKGSSSDQFDKDFEVGGTSENHQNNVVKVTKVAQDYAKSGAQTEKVNSDDMETAESGNLSGENTDNKNIFEGEEHAEESLVYQLLKDVIEKQTSVFANDLVLENAKLEKRVDHLERENALLQRTSKRLHLALKAVFKNREKAKVPRSSCGVQVNMDLNQPSFSLTPVVNIDIPDERNSKEKPFEKMENSSSFSAINESSLTSSQKNRIPTGEDSAQSPSEQEKSGGEPKMVEVTMTTIGTQTQEHTTPKYFTEGMGHFKLQCLRHRGKPSIVDSGEKSHYKMTPHGLQLKTKWSASSKNHEEESRTEVIDTSCTKTKDLSKSPIRGTFSLRKNISTDQNCTMSDKEKRTSPFSENLRRNEEHAANTDVADHPRAKHMSTSTARSNESLRTHLKTSQKSQNESLVAREHEQEASYRDPQSPVIPKHSISTAIKTVNLPRDQSSKGKEEPDLIIVSSNEPSPPRMAMPSLRSNNESSFRAVQNEVKSKTKEREMIERREREMLEQKKREIMERKEREMLERKEREVLARQEKEMLERQRPVYYSQSIRQQKRNEMLVERIMSENTIPKSTPVTLDNLNPNSQEMRKSNAVHMSQIQSQQTLQYTNAVMRAREQSAQPITAQGAPRPQRYGAPEMMVVSQTEGRENGSAPRGSSLPPQLIPSQPQRVQEQLRPPRSISFETAETQRNQGQTISGIAQVNNAIHLQRAQVAAQSNRSQQPLQQTHLSQQQQQQQQQQHLIARQQHLQQIATPGYQQPRAGNLQGLTQQHPRASQPNIARQQAPPPYQSPHRLQQIPRPMVDPGRSHANMPLSPEFGRTFIQRAPYKDAPPHLIPGNVQQTRQGPVVVYQPGALEGGVRPAAPTSQAQFERLQDQMRQAQNPPQGQISQPPQRVTNAVAQLPPSIQSQRTTSCEMQQVNDRRARVVPERPQQTHVNTSSSQRSPPKPSASIAIVENGIVLSWNVSPEQDTSDIDSYELFACQDDSNSSCPPVLWKKIGVVKALPLPMACTLTQFSNGSRYQFAVRAVDSSERAGPFSDPCVILLKKS